jgi:hypothetical protein
MHAEPHYRLRRLTSSHPLEDPCGNDDEEEHPLADGDSDDVLVHRFFMVRSARQETFTFVSNLFSRLRTKCLR